MSKPSNISSINTSFDQTTLFTTTRRYNATLSSPPSPSSPLARPPFVPGSPTLSDDGEGFSPASTALMTPYHTGGSSSGSVEYTFNSSPSYDNAPSSFKSDHSALASLAQMPSPNLNLQSESAGSSPSPPALNRLNAFPFPLLPPHHPLRSKMYSTSGSAMDGGRRASESTSLNDDSIPCTPKGHPLDGRIRYPKDLKTISRPYGSIYHKQNPTTLSGMRVPRRMRPYLLVLFCCFVFGIVLVNNAATNAAASDRARRIQVDDFSHAQAAALSRRQAEMADLKAQREKSRYALLAEMAEMAIQAAPATSIRFENTQEELAALIGFVTSTTANALPDIDPTRPLEPGVVLDFDPTRPGAREDLELLVSEVNTVYPLVLFGKMRDPWYREVQKTLAAYKITPAPLVVDVDQRRDQSVFIPLLARLLDTEELPQLLLKGTSLGSYHDILALQDKGELVATLEAGGLVVRDQKKKKKGVKERERIENERVLGPAPIHAE